MNWRLCQDDGAAAARGLATDELLLQRVGAGSAPPTLRLYTYRPHCALVGRFQTAAHELHLPYCERHGIDVNRRPTGGGAILMGPDQLGVALALRGRGDGLPDGARALMQRFSLGLGRGLGILGVTAVFRGKNDLAVDGRKIAGLGVCRDASGGLLFHASLLVDLDVPLMARVLRLPHGEGEPDARELAVLARRVTTVRERLARAVSVDEVRARIAAGFAAAFGATLEAADLSADEQRGVDALLRDKYATAAWVQQETPVADRLGTASVRSDAGAVRAHVALAGPTLKQAQLRGTFFASEQAIADLEARLGWLPLGPGAVAAAVAAWAAAFPDEGVPAQALVAALEAAIAHAHAAAPAAPPPPPQGCFVLPEARHG